MKSSRTSPSPIASENAHHNTLATANAVSGHNARRANAGLTRSASTSTRIGGSVIIIGRRSHTSVALRGSQW